MNPNLTREQIFPFTAICSIKVFSASLGKYYNQSKAVCLCQCVNQSSTKHNHCTQRLAILHAQTYSWTLIAN